MISAALEDPLFKEPHLALVGEILKSTRLARGVTLEEVARELCISRRQLSYIEDNTEYTLCDVYTLGFVKLYAQYLGLDAQDLVQKFREQTVSSSKPTAFTFPAPLPGRGLPSRLILILSFLALIAIAIGWHWLGSFSLEIPSFFKR
jgi:cytoskeleton protein RodZ